MRNRIHILGASGSGTTTLAKNLSKVYGYLHFDTDDFFWEKSDPPFQKQRSVEERLVILKELLTSNKKWILSGSLCGWGDELIPYFDLVVYLWLPEKIRISRLLEREKGRYGDKILAGGSMYESHVDFMTWTKKYDTGGLEVRSKYLHHKWLECLPCASLKLEGNCTLEEKIIKVSQYN